MRQKFATLPQWARILIIAVPVVFVPTCAGLITPEKAQQIAATPTPKAATADEIHVVTGNYIGTKTEEDLRLTTRMVLADDRAAIQQMLEQGRAILLKKGTRVYLEGCAGSLCSTVKLRPEGSATVVYAEADAIR